MSATTDSGMVGQNPSSLAPGLDDPLEKDPPEIRVEALPTSASSPPDLVAQEVFRPDVRFWLIFAALSCTSLLGALDLGGIGTAAPTIVHDLNGSDFTWVAASYALSSAACIPVSGNLAQIFGRRSVCLAGVVLFAIGSAVCGSAESMTILIIGRTVQGIGTGTMQALTSIIITDLVPLRDRGAYAGVTGVIISAGSAAGPFIAGGLAEKATWRWLFYLNLPLSAITFFTVAIFLRLKKPEGDIRKKLLEVDWIGDFLIMASTASCMIALTLGGVQFPWSSWRIIVPLVIGLIGFGITLYYEAHYPQRPVIPLIVVSNRTSFCAYIATFLQSMVTLSVAFFLPTWFQAVKAATPLQSGLYILPLSLTISPLAIIQGVVVSKTGRYRPVLLTGWVLTLLSVGLLISLRPGTPIGVLVPYQILMGIGMGFLYVLTVPVLAPLPLSANGPAIAFQVFLRQFSTVWGFAMAGAILQNTLKPRLPPAILTDSRFSSLSGGQLAYAIIPAIRGLSDPTKGQVQAAFNGSLRLVWIAFTACNAVGLLTFFAMKDYPLSQTVDGNWGINRDNNKSKTEKSVA